MQWDETEQYKQLKAKSDKLRARRTKEEQAAYDKMIDDTISSTRNMPRWKMKWLTLSADIFILKKCIVNMYKRLLRVIIKY